MAPTALAIMSIQLGYLLGHWHHGRLGRRVCQRRGDVPSTSSSPCRRLRVLTLSGAMGAGILNALISVTAAFIPPIARIAEGVTKSARGLSILRKHVPANLPRDTRARENRAIGCY
jgi:hypothetical protein